MNYNATTTFTDWAGQEIVYTVRERSREDRADGLGAFRCEINPHGDAWHSAGTGRTAQEAMNAAREYWNEYDQRG